MRSAFTLIELLVVITIIVILLALLMPALDQAIYQAELATCSGRLKTVGSGVTLYAMDHKQQYPYRPWVYNGGWRPNHLWNRVGGVFDKDERTMVRPYLGGMNKLVQCPFNTEMELDPGASAATGAADESNQGWGSYYLLYGWVYHVGKVFDKPMRKIGDRFEYTDKGDGSQPPVVDRFDILAGDYEMFNGASSFPNPVGSHPDKGASAIMFQYVLDGQSTSGAGIVPGTNITISRWAGRAARGPIDMNFAHGDGSVSRLIDVVWESSPGVADERMATILETSNKSDTFYTNLPPSR